MSAYIIFVDFMPGENRHGTPIISEMTARGCGPFADREEAAQFAAERETLFPSIDWNGRSWFIFDTEDEHPLTPPPPPGTRKIPQTQAAP